MEFMKTSDFPTTEYSGISGIYFNKIIEYLGLNESHLSAVYEITGSE